MYYFILVSYLIETKIIVLNMHTRKTLRSEFNVCFKPWLYQYRHMEHINMKYIGLVVRMSILDKEVDRSNSYISMFYP